MGCCVSSARARRSEPEVDHESMACICNYHLVCSGPFQIYCDQPYNDYFPCPTELCRGWYALDTTKTCVLENIYDSPGILTRGPFDASEFFGKIDYPWATPVAPGKWLESIERQECLSKLLGVLGPYTFVYCKKPGEARKAAGEGVKILPLYVELLDSNIELDLSTGLFRYW